MPFIDVSITHLLIVQGNFDDAQYVLSLHYS